VNEHNVTLESGGDSYPGRLNAPEGSTDSGVLVLPGGGHGPFGDVFDRVATTAGDAGHAVARFETWTGPDDLDAKTDADLAAEIDAGVDFLRSEDCSTITVVAKSFGGRLALEHAPDVDRMVLWAPAVFFGEREDRPSIDAAALSGIDAPVRILQGDEDDLVSVDNAQALAKHLPGGEVVELPGEDHSMLTDEGRVVEATLAFLPE
jgi:pimeloyl-ACP methyl ester carboxylesterase